MLREALSYPPILRGLVALAVAGLTLPLPGIFVLQLGLVPLRFTLMHTGILAGVLALVLGLPAVPAVLGLALVVALAVGLAGRFDGRRTSNLTVVLMVVTTAVAFTLMSRTGILAKDVLGLLWGDLYAVRSADLAVLAGLGCLIVAFFAVFYRRAMALVFDRDMAAGLGIPVRALELAIVLLCAAAVAVGLRVTGALLLDGLLLLPPLAAARLARSARAHALIACGMGLASAAAGFAISLAFDLPAGATTALAATALWLAASGISRITALRRKNP
jgi:zinc transport system permease protein